MTTCKQRLLTAIEGKTPDRLPVTTHHLMPYFLNKYMDGISNDAFFDYFGLDPILWINPNKPDQSRGEYYDPTQPKNTDSSSKRIVSDNWRIEPEEIADPQYKTTRYNIVTPKGTLTTVLQSNDQTEWVTEHLVKDKNDIALIAEFATAPSCDVEAVNQSVKEFGERGIVRNHVCCFDLSGQPGCWQDACCLYGVEKMMMATFDDPQWVHEFLKILQKRKMRFLESTKGADFDIIELGGGDASTTVISPQIFKDFVAPYDSELIEIAHKAGQKIVYHTCGGMMPILEDIAAMGPDAMETFTPPAMGGDTDLAEAKKRIGDKICMIGGFDQFHHLLDCSPQETRTAVRQCFEQAGADGGYILCMSDHFFDADIELIKAFADEAKKCVY